MGSEGGGPVIKFHLTGFKKFHNVTDNPTEVLVGRVMEFMKDRPLPFGATVESCTVLETAGAGAVDFLLSLLDSAAAETEHTSSDVQIFSPKHESGNTRVVWLHFGVNSCASRFAVEQRAVNEATFRCPDEMGWQPEGLPIVPSDESISHFRETKFSTWKIVDSLVKQGFDVVVSDDAGRFVCNYVYYQSLKHAADHGTKSLFVHVPPFSVINESTQMEFVSAILTVLASSA